MLNYSGIGANPSMNFVPVNKSNILSNNTSGGKVIPQSSLVGLQKGHLTSVHPQNRNIKDDQGRSSKMSLGGRGLAGDGKQAQESHSQKSRQKMSYFTGGNSASKSSKFQSISRNHQGQRVVGSDEKKDGYLGFQNASGTSSANSAVLPSTGPKKLRQVQNQSKMMSPSIFDTKNQNLKELTSGLGVGGFPAAVGDSQKQSYHQNHFGLGGQPPAFSTEVATLESSNNNPKNATSLHHLVRNSKGQGMLGNGLMGVAGGAGGQQQFSKQPPSITLGQLLPRPTNRHDQQRLWKDSPAHQNSSQ